MKLLLIEDDEDILDHLKTGFESEAFAVDAETQGDKGSYLARTNDYDCIILDYVLPHKDGPKICKEIRDNGTMAPIIMLTVCSDTEKKIKVLNSGADDYVTKPYSFKELLARVRAVTRRPRVMLEQVMTIDTLTIDCNKQRVTRNSQGIYLTRKEFSLLEFLMRHKGIVVSRGMIMEHVWSSDTNPFSNTIEAHILNLRRKIAVTKDCQELIHCVPGRGYKIDVDK